MQTQETMINCPESFAWFITHQINKLMHYYFSHHLGERTHTHACVLNGCFEQTSSKQVDRMSIVIMFIHCIVQHFHIKKSIGMILPQYIVVYRFDCLCLSVNLKNKRSI